MLFLPLIRLPASAGCRVLGKSSPLTLSVSLLHRLHLTYTPCHPAGLVPAQVQHPHRDAIREQQWLQRQREYDGEADGGMRMRRVIRWGEGAQSAAQRQTLFVHNEKESGPLNKATDGQTFPQRLPNQSRTLFRPLFPFLTSALACCRGIRSSDKTRHVEGARTLCREKCSKACFGCR